MEKAGASCSRHGLSLHGGHLFPVTVWGPLPYSSASLCLSCSLTGWQRTSSCAHDERGRTGKLMRAHPHLSFCKFCSVRVPFLKSGVRPRGTDCSRLLRDSPGRCATYFQAGWHREVTEASGQLIEKVLPSGLVAPSAWVCREIHGHVSRGLGKSGWRGQLFLEAPARWRWPPHAHLLAKGPGLESTGARLLEPLASCPGVLCLRAPQCTHSLPPTWWWHRAVWAC